MLSFDSRLPIPQLSVKNQLKKRILADIEKDLDKYLVYFEDVDTVYDIEIQKMRAGHKRGRGLEAGL